jgi:uncharacterized membrane protein (DUF2068 family)
MRLPELIQGFINGLHHVIGSLFAVQLQQLSQFADKANQNWHNAFWLVTVYALLRFIEAYGLYRDKTWAYWYSVQGNRTIKIFRTATFHGKPYFETP